MPTTIEQLELEVQSSSTSAVAGIDALSASLSKLKNAVRGGVGLTSVANQVRNLDTALKSMDSSGADKIDKLASSLEKLKGLGSLKISSSIGNQLQNIGSAAASLTGVDFSAMEKLGTALQPLNKGSDWKPQVQRFNMTYLLELSKMQRDLENMEYEFLPTTNFTLHERGKLRRITGEQVQDRIVKHALCDEVLNPLIEPRCTDSQRSQDH